jgi:asparagine synthase (glutamine-hydrolysing)
MSAIFGVFNRDGATVSPAVTEVLEGALDYWSPDSRGTVDHGPLVIGQYSLFNTPESRLDPAPRDAEFGDERYVLALDARLDNRGELVAELFPGRCNPRTVADSDILLAAYRRWGEDCPAHLLGDFAFAIWDAGRRQVFCARDHVGVKQLYYNLDERIFVFASDVRAVVAHPAVPDDIQDRLVFSYIYEICQPDITFFRTVSRLPAASSMTVSAQCERRLTYWRPEESPPVQLTSTDEYAEALLALLSEAVATRCRSDYALGAHLSGGLDSTLVSVLAARELAAGNRRLHAFNWLGAPAEGDDARHFEWSHGSRVAVAEAIDYHLVDTSAALFRNIYARHDLRFMDTLDFWNEFAVRTAAADLGIRTLLSGWGGDELSSFNGGVSLDAELFWQGRFTSALSGYWQRSRRGRLPPLGMLRRVGREIVAPCFSRRRFDAVYNAVAGTFYHDAQPLACLTAGYAALDVDMCPQPGVPPRRFGHRYEQLSRYQQGSVQQRLEAWASSGWRPRIEYRYPLLDKRVVEFALGVPLELFRQQGRHRYLFRSTLAKIVPADIAWSETKFENERADRHNRRMFEFLQAFLAGEVPEVPPVESNRIVDRDNWLAFSSRALQGGLDLRNLDQMIMMMIAGKGILLSRIV